MPQRHDLTDPANVYVNRTSGKRQCRRCKLESARRHRANRIHSVPVITKRSRRKSYENWAKATWESMSEPDRRLLRAWAQEEN